MESLKCLRDEIIDHVLENVDCLSYEEMGEAIDMIKDLEEAMYYHTHITSKETSTKSLT